ncbi:hypothetical protein J3F83DRAFT_712128 [Trichoderma novae-zelandiae]
MQFSTIFTLVPYPKRATLGDITLFLPIWAFLFTVWVLLKVAIALWPTVLAYLSFVAAFAPDENFVVAVVSWLSLLRYWKPWASATADLRREVDLAIDCTFLAWFLMAFPFIVLTTWVGLTGVLRLVANVIIRRIHHAMEFEFDLTDYVVKCYSPMEIKSWGDRIFRRQLPGFNYYRDEYLVYSPGEEYNPWPRGRDPLRPRRSPPRTESEKRLDRDDGESRRAIKAWIKQKRAEIQAAKDQARIAAEQLNAPTPTPFDSEPVPQSRETAAPAVQSSAWHTVRESDHVADDVTTASNPMETEEPADQSESKGEGLVVPGPKAPEPEVSSEAEGNGLLEGVEDSKAQEPETSHEGEGESLAEEPNLSREGAGEGPLCTDSQAQEPEFSSEKEGDGFVAEEPETSHEEEGEGPVEEPKFSPEDEGEDPAEESESSPEEEGESSLFVRDHANGPEAMSTATVPQAAQELETSLEVKGDGMLMVIGTDRTEEPEASSEVEGEGDGMLMIVESAQTEEPEVSPEAEGEGFTENEASIGVDFDVEMADFDEPMVPRPLSPSGNSNSQVSILPLEVVAPWSPAGQEPGVHYDTRGCMGLSPVVGSAQSLVEAQ